MTQLISTQKIKAVLKKANLSLNTGRYSSGYSVYKTFNDSPEIYVNFSSSSFSSSSSAKFPSYQENRINRLALAAQALILANIPVHMTFDVSKNTFSMIVWRDSNTKVRSYYQPWDTDLLLSSFAEIIQAEKAATKAEEDRKQSQADERRYQAELKFNLAKSLNPSFLMIIDDGSVKVLRVKMLDNRVATLTLGVLQRPSIWHNGADVLRVEILALMPSEHTASEFETRRDTVDATDPAETLEDLVYAWIARKS